MLTVSPLRSTSTKDEDQEQMESFSTVGIHDFSDLSDKNLLESIDFDDLFVGINDGDALPELEMDPEILAEFSICGSREDSEVNASASNGKVEDNPRKEQEGKFSGSGTESELDSSLSTRSEEIVSRRDDSPVVLNPAVTHKPGDKGRKSSKHNRMKRKVDWTPELHRRFMQAVEQLGMDKAVPSRILELMGISSLTRHNVASHLQKYRSHRKHLLDREAEAASWSQRRKMYGADMAGGNGKREMNPWQPPTVGFPPCPITSVHHPFTPLHVWGHPSMHPSLTHIWPRPFARPPPRPHTWATPPPAPSYWHQHHQSKESIDAAVGDALSKPWQPLPLGLKPPSLDSVLEELQRQGIPKIPPSCS